MKVYKIISVLIVACLLAIACSVSSCVPSNKVSEKTGVQLWSENCNRCHNAPSPTDFTDAQWVIIGTHMRIRANLMDMEVNKIVEFLQSAN